MRCIQYAFVHFMMMHILNVIEPHMAMLTFGSTFMNQIAFSAKKIALQIIPVREMLSTVLALLLNPFWILCTVPFMSKIIVFQSEFPEAVLAVNGLWWGLTCSIGRGCSKESRTPHPWLHGNGACGGSGCGRKYGSTHFANL